MRTSLLNVASALLVLACGAGYRALEGCPCPCPSMASAVIRVSLPADAKVFFDDEATSSTGDNRQYTTPPLPFGRDLQYTLRAEVPRTPKAKEIKPQPPEGQDSVPEDDEDPGPKPASSKDSESKSKKSAGAIVVVSRKITVRAGAVTHVDFGDITLQEKE